MEYLFIISRCSSCCWKSFENQTDKLPLVRVKSVNSPKGSRFRGRGMAQFVPFVSTYDTNPHAYVAVVICFLFFQLSDFFYLLSLQIKLKDQKCNQCNIYIVPHSTPKHNSLNTKMLPKSVCFPLKVFRYICQSPLCLSKEVLLHEILRFLCHSRYQLTYQRYLKMLHPHLTRRITKVFFWNGKPSW